MPAVLIRGDGIAGCCSARLLVHAGFRLAVERLNRPKLPAIMLGDTAQKLLKDVFEQQDLFAGVPRIRRRVVAWGRDSEPLSLPHSAVVVSEQWLLDRIQRELWPDEQWQVEAPEWTIFASSPLRPGSMDHHFGSRMAAASAVKLKPGGAFDTCWIESLESGWLFLLPSGEGNGWLLSVGGPAELLLAAGRLIPDQIDEISAARGAFPCHPRIAQPLAEPGWLACGSGALGFDPLCGDGTGNAAREAILASAVVRAASEGADVKNIVAHYRARLLAGFQRHLELCRDFYTAGRSGPWWDSQLDDLNRGLMWCSQQTVDTAGFRYRLNGFVLEAVQPAG